MASGQSLAAPLLQDLLDPTNTPLQICLIHDITLDQLAAIITSDAFQQASAHLDTITRARAAAIESNTKLQTQSLQRTIAHDAYLAATDMDQANTARDPNRAAIKARYLETARKAISCPSPRPAGRWPDKVGSEGSSFSSPGLPGEVSAQPTEGVLLPLSPLLVPPPFLTGEVPSPRGGGGLVSRTSLRRPPPSSAAPNPPPPSGRGRHKAGS